MHPWLLEHPPISTYGTCIVLALVVAWLWARFRARAAGVDSSRIDLLMPVLMGAGLLGAWGFGKFTDALTGELANGTVLVGALLTATAAGIGYALLCRIRLGILADICAAPLALGIGIGRVGCFFAGCCYGSVCAVPVRPAWLTGVRFPAGSLAYVHQVRVGELVVEGTNSSRQAGSYIGVQSSLPVYPVQLYESALCVLLAVVIWRWRVRDERGVTGQKFLAMGLGYAGIRFGLEFLRADNPPVGGLTFSQWGAILIAVLALTTWILRCRHATAWGLRRGQPTSIPG